MITRRSFLGTVAAVAMSPVASKAAPVAAERFRFVQTFAPLPFDNLPRRPRHDSGAAMTEPKKPEIFQVRVDPDCDLTDIYLIPAKRDPKWTDEDVARRSGVIRDVRLPK